MPDGAVYVGRPTKFGNPYNSEAWIAAVAVGRYREWIYRDKQLLGQIVNELKGRDLACWCPLDQPCHADVLLEVANAD
jgi:hypothetical protein